MEKSTYDELILLPDHALYDFVTETDGSQRKWVAMHILELRRHKELTRAAKSSANAAWVAALFAGGALALSLLTRQ